MSGARAVAMMLSGLALSCFLHGREALLEFSAERGVWAKLAVAAIVGVYGGATIVAIQHFGRVP